jgi:hypothetical protein
MQAPVSKKTAVKPSDLDELDLIDRTMELDMRWLQYEKSAEQDGDESRGSGDDPTVVLDLTATQVHDLLSTKKK